MKKNKLKQIIDSIKEDGVIIKFVKDDFRGPTYEYTTKRIRIPINKVKNDKIKEVPFQQKLEIILLHEYGHHLDVKNNGLNIMEDDIIREMRAWMYAKEQIAFFGIDECYFELLKEKCLETYRRSS